ncbi:unnamed protein product, partial [Durusdinium trenchii]
LYNSDRGGSSRSNSGSDRSAGRSSSGELCEADRDVDLEGIYNDALVRGVRFFVADTLDLLRWRVEQDCFVGPAMIDKVVNELVRFPNKQALLGPLLPRQLDEDWIRRVPDVDSSAVLPLTFCRVRGHFRDALRILESQINLAEQKATNAQDGRSAFPESDRSVTPLRHAEADIACAEFAQVLQALIEARDVVRDETTPGEAEHQRQLAHVESLLVARDPRTKLLSAEDWTSDLTLSLARTHALFGCDDRALQLLDGLFDKRDVSKLHRSDLSAVLAILKRLPLESGIPLVFKLVSWVERSRSLAREEASWSSLLQHLLFVAKSLDTAGLDRHAEVWAVADEVYERGLDVAAMADNRLAAATTQDLHTTLLGMYYAIGQYDAGTEFAKNLAEIVELPQTGEQLEAEMFYWAYRQHDPDSVIRCVADLQSLGAEPSTSTIECIVEAYL